MGSHNDNLCSRNLLGDIILRLLADLRSCRPSPPLAQPQRLGQILNILCLSSNALERSLIHPASLLLPLPVADLVERRCHRYGRLLNSFWHFHLPLKATVTDAMCSAALPMKGISIRPMNLSGNLSLDPRSFANPSLKNSIWTSFGSAIQDFSCR